MNEPINFFLQNNDHLKPRDEVRIEKLGAEAMPDGRRIKVQMEVTPFRERPSFEIALFDEAQRKVGGTTVIEAMTFRMEFVLHLRGVTEPAGTYTLRAALYYEDPSAPQHLTQTTVHVSAPTS